MRDVALTRRQQKRTRRPAPRSSMPTASALQSAPAAKIAAAPGNTQAQIVVPPAITAREEAPEHPEKIEARGKSRVRAAQGDTLTAQATSKAQKSRKTAPATKTSAQQKQAATNALAATTQTTRERRYPTLARMAAIAPRPTAPANPLTDTVVTPPDMPPMSTPKSASPVADETEELSPIGSSAETNFDVDRLDTLDIHLESEETSLTELAEEANMVIAPRIAPAPQIIAPTESAPLAPRVPVRTRNLRDLRDIQDGRNGKTAPTRAVPRPSLTETDPLLRQYPLTRPQPLPATNLVIPIAVVEASVAAVAAISMAVLMLVGSAGAYWALALTVIAGLGGLLAYALAHDDASQRSAGAILLASQLGMLAWGMALLGPRASLLALLPIVLLLALRTTNRVIASLGVVVALAVYGLFELLSLNNLVRPALQLNTTLAAVFDGIFVVSGMLLLLRAVLDIHASRSKAEILARSRLHELRQVRARAAQVRQQSEEDALRLHDTLMAALYGRTDTSPAPSTLEGPLNQLNEAVGLLGERMTVLQRDREERLRLEGALRRLTRAVERAWLGLPWKWPEPSGTSLDELVALLRTPNPREARPDALLDTPAALVPIPSLDPSLTPAPWEAPALHPRVREHLSDPSWSFGQQPTNGARLNGPASRISPLPWLEWDEWRDWDDRFSS